jgi:hypothetical protein
VAGHSGRHQYAALTREEGQMPSSVLLAILVGAGVLALMPALARRYDSAVRGQAELHTSSMRVLLRRRRQRTVCPSAPINPPSALLADRIVGRATVADALTPGDSESDALVRAALVRDTLARDDATRAARRATAAGGEPTQQVATVDEPRRARAGQPILDNSQLQHWRRFRRRRVLLAFSLLVVGQVAGVAFVGPGFWAGLGVSTVLMFGYIVRLRAAAAAERRQLAAERARRHRAYEFVRVATRDLRVPNGAAARAAGWLATPREERRRPTREVARVLALAGRETVRVEDGTWVVRKAPEPAPQPRRVVPSRTAARVAAHQYVPVLSDLDEPLPRAVNL